MTRTFLRAAIATALLAGCGGSPKAAPDAPDADAWQAYYPWKSDNPLVKKTASGLEYIVLAEGPAGGKSPPENAQATLHYQGRLASNGVEFDTSFGGEPATFPVGEVVPGFSEALQAMKPGDSWLVFIPAKLGYGARGTPGGPIPPNADLIFEIEMKDFTVPPSSDAEAWAKHTPWNSANVEVKKTGSGVEYIVLKSGDAAGKPPARDQMAEVFYEGRLNAGGEPFDSAFERGGSEVFPVAAVVPGFSEALQLMKPGDHWLVYIPSALGYGARGTPGGPIPPNADLVFEILLVAAH